MGLDLNMVRNVAKTPWRKINKCRLLYFRCLDLIDQRLETDMPLNIARLAESLKVDAFDIEQLYAEYPRIPRLVAQYQRLRNMHTSGICFSKRYDSSVMVKYQRGIRILAKKNMHKSQASLARELCLSAETVRRYLLRHPSVKQALLQ